MNKKLGHLIIWQHAPLLIGMLILFIALGAWTGFRMNQHWQMLDQNHDMLISGLKYDHRRQHRNDRQHWQYWEYRQHRDHRRQHHRRHDYRRHHAEGREDLHHLRHHAGQG
ncbi:hypothetical protein [uncultured Lactiplantibacillus sp.]|uniref:hypothetical protein n=1 Tax=uncultured Lactiplantibacillus sp. TaxID=2767844 RepID=UPI00259B3D89|nr:hypothetical protein [uncultured Lactiplantibacillus sp.]